MGPLVVVVVLLLLLLPPTCLQVAASVSNNQVAFRSTSQARTFNGIDSHGWLAARSAVPSFEPPTDQCAVCLPGSAACPPPLLPADNTNHFFRVDRGFVAQTADINGGRTAPMNALQQVGVCVGSAVAFTVLCCAVHAA